MDINYHAIQLEPQELLSISAHFNRPHFKGANITIPYKQTLLDYVDELDDVAGRFGAINTIVKQRGRLIGYNTDAYGFSVPLQEFSEELNGARAIVFGTGGASKAIVYALRNLDVREIILVSRSPGKFESNMDEGDVSLASYDSWTAWADEAALIVNATPLGMEPDERHSPVCDSEVDGLTGKICYDIVYKPLQTRFIGQAKSVGARTIGGLEMLIHQGSKSFELWTGRPFPIREIRESLYGYLGK
jgi:shikimate dehydrogenase